jgi:hypothetical protein
MKIGFLIVGAVGLVLASAGCGRPFKVKTAPGFVELENQEPQFGYRAVAPEGVVMGVRVVDIADHGDLAFWERAVTLRMRQVDGYALLDTHDTASLDGTKGRELDFGHDENGKPFAYRVRMFVAQDRLFVAEVGGAKENMDRYKSSVDWMFTSLEVQCGGFLAPVFSSRTCNRW